MSTYYPVPTSAQTDLMSPNNAWEQSNVIADGETGYVGMFGDDDS